MGVEILCRVDQSTKSLPGGISIYARLQGIQYGLALGGDVIVPGLKGVIVEVEFRVPKLVAQGILPQVGGDDNVQSSEAKKRFQGLMADLPVIVLQHGLVYKNCQVSKTWQFWDDQACASPSSS